MIKSMTAFARKEMSEGNTQVVWEIKSVNHRYLEMSFRLPDKFKQLEQTLRNTLRKRLTRGKVECSLKIEESQSTSDAFEVNEALIQQLTEAAQSVETILGVAKPVEAYDILKWPGVVSQKQVDAEKIEKDAEGLFEETLTQFIQNREREGEELKEMISTRIEKVDSFITVFKNHLPETMKKHREKLESRLAQVIEKSELKVDQDRLEQELVIFAQKIDIEEELDRLEAHCREVKRVLQEGGAVGRRLDFLMQELNREANTTGSKSANAEQSQAVVDLKVCIEQMREQIQNIE